MIESRAVTELNAIWHDLFNDMCGLEGRLKVDLYERRADDRTISAVSSRFVACYARLHALHAKLNTPFDSPFETSFSVRDLVCAIEELARALSDERLRVGVSWSCDMDRIIVGSVATVRMAVEELVRNGRKAGASRIDIDIGWTASVLVVKVTDNGSGMTDHHLDVLGVRPTGGASKGNGGWIISDIVHGLGGKVSWSSDGGGPGASTSCRLCLPLS